MSTIGRLIVTLRISGDRLDPDEITRLLGKEPDRVQRRGQPMQTPSGRPGPIMRFSSWSLTADEFYTGDMDLQVAQILDRTTSDLEVWRRIASTFKMDLFCGLFMAGGNEGLMISPATLRDLGEREIALGLDIYGTGDVEGLED